MEKKNIKIVILQRGWVMIGDFKKEGQDCKLKNAFVIRRWGTSHGLGELAKKGPLTDTVLDPCFFDVDFDYLTVVATIGVDQNLWAEKLKE